MWRERGIELSHRTQPDGPEGAYSGDGAASAVNGKEDVGQQQRRIIFYCGSGWCMCTNKI